MAIKDVIKDALCKYPYVKPIPIVLVQENMEVNPLNKENEEDNEILEIEEKDKINKINKIKSENDSA